MNPSLPTRTTLTLSLCLMALAGVQTYEHYRLSHLTDAIAQAAENSPAEIVLTRMGRVEERLNDADSQHLVSGEDFRSAQQALSNRIDTLKDQVKQAADTLQNLSDSAASAEDVITLKASIESIGAQLSDLQKAQARSASLPPERPVRKTSPAPKAKRISPPFTAIGIEYRGDLQFLSIAPIGSTKLDQVQLIRPGEIAMETGWKLLYLDTQGAHFDVAGTPYTVGIVP